MSALYSLASFKAAYALAHFLPRPAAQALAALVGRTAYRRKADTQAALRGNLRPVANLSGAALDALCMENVTNFSRMLGDYFLCVGGDAARQCDTLIEGWRGFENLAAAREAGRGTIVVTGHLGHWELGGLVLARRDLPLTIVTLEEPSTGLTRWREACRRRLGIKTITVGPGHPFAFVEMIQTLRRNELVAMLVDRPYADSGARVRLFGRDTEFSTAPALLARHTGAAVLPAFVLRQSSGRYVSLAEPVVPMLATKDPRSDLTANTQRIATAFEGIIRQYPAQWFNYVPVWSKREAASA
ncbi:MAG: lysophospholipid acyltransferase family protein [Chthoniobacter sp.]|nr:lysophospholipid acyltransferase family protein [Chthoniobacter sp.]